MTKIIITSIIPVKIYLKNFSKNTLKNTVDIYLPYKLTVMHFYVNSFTIFCRFLNINTIIVNPFISILHLTYTILVLMLACRFK